MEKEELFINKDNYKGYVDLFKTRKKLIDSEFNSVKKFLIKICIIFFTGLFLTVTSTILLKFLIISENIITCELFAIIGLIAAVVIKEFDGYKKLYQQKMNALKERYPYLDLSISDKELEKILTIANILIDDFNLDVEGYETYLKCEEIKDNYLEETKYDGYIVNPPVELEELEKPKVKKLVR